MGEKMLEVKRKREKEIRNRRGRREVFIVRKGCQWNG